MHSVVVYDSQFGNTEQIALVIARTLSAFGPARAAHVHETAMTQLRDVDLLVLGCPAQAWHADSAMRLFVLRLPLDVLRGPKVVCFDTRTHQPGWLRRFAAPQLEKTLRQRGITPFAAAAGFYVRHRSGPLEAGTVERAAEWARSMGQQAAGTASDKLET